MLVRSAHYNILTGANEAIAGFDEKGVALELSMKVNSAICVICVSLNLSWTAMDVWGHATNYSLLEGWLHVYNGKSSQH